MISLPAQMQQHRSQSLPLKGLPLNSQMPSHPKRRKIPMTAVNQSRSSPRSGLTVWLVAGQSILWPQSTTVIVGPTLLTGLKLGEEDRLVDDLMDWERKIGETPIWTITCSSLQGRSTDCVKSILWKQLPGKMALCQRHKGLPSDQLDQRIQGFIATISIYGVQTKTTNCST